MVRKENIRKIIAEYLRYFPKNIKVEGVFVFGSYARGDYNEDSDLDLIIISPYFRNIDFLKRLELLSSFRKSPVTRSLAMDIVGYTQDEFRAIDRESVVMKRAKKEGVMIYPGITGRH